MEDDASGGDALEGAPTLVQDLQGLRQALIESVLEGSRVVEAMHGTIARAPLPLSAYRTRSTRGLTRLAYRNVRGVTTLVGFVVDRVLRQLAPLLGQRTDTQTREALVGAINGLVGAHLEASANPLALRMRLRQEGRAIPTDTWRPTHRHLVLMAHGSCMSDVGFTRKGHNHGHLLANALPVDVIHVNYNSGLPIQRNGKALDVLLEAFLEGPCAGCAVTLIGFSMGGLVIRSALHAAEQRDAVWPARVGRLITLGTPHHGAPLEQGGHVLTRLLDVTPYSAPLAHLATVRGPGIQDLRHGAITEADHAAITAGALRVSRTPTPLPQHLEVHAIAATLSDPYPNDPLRARSDGLVPVASALGLHTDPALNLAFPEDQKHVIAGCSHLGLLNHPEVGRLLVNALSTD